MNIIGMNKPTKSSQLKCIDNFILTESDFNKYLNTTEKDTELIIVCIYNDKIVGLIMFSLYSGCTPQKNCFDIMISNPFLCYEKDIMSSKDVVYFIEKSLSIAKEHYLPYYNKLKQIVKSDVK